MYRLISRCLTPSVPTALLLSDAERADRSAAVLRQAWRPLSTVLAVSTEGQTVGVLSTKKIDGILNILCDILAFTSNKYHGNRCGYNPHN